MKLLSVGVPSYNSEAYLCTCIDSLLLGGDRIEIIIIDDGSTDSTGKIADEYAANYPNIVKVIHQENSGHGEGVNQGLKNATGLYYKVVDSDDYLDKDALLKLLDQIEEHYLANNSPDMYICNFVYDHTCDNTKYVSRYSKYMKKNSFNTWENVKRFSIHHLLLMHALYYKRDVLLKSETVLPKHCFYVDDYYSFKPLAFCHNFFYLDVNLYIYRIGRSDQSVNINNFLKRYDQQVKVMNLMLSSFSYNQIMNFPKGLRNYLFHALSAINITTTLFILGGKDEQQKRREIFIKYMADMKKRDYQMYHKLKYRSYYALILPFSTSVKRVALVQGYKLTCKFCKLG